MTPDDTLDAGVDPSFTFHADELLLEGFKENPLHPKDGATIFYSSSSGGSGASAGQSAQEG